MAFTLTHSSCHQHTCTTLPFAICIEPPRYWIFPLLLCILVSNANASLMKAIYAEMKQVLFHTYSSCKPTGKPYPKIMLAGRRQSARLRNRSVIVHISPSPEAQQSCCRLARQHSKSEPAAKKLFRRANLGRRRVDGRFRLTRPADAACAPPSTPPTLSRPLIATMFKFSSSNSASLLARSLLTKQQVPVSSRSFHASAANMVVKAHFDVAWTGPEYQTDASGKVTSKDDSVKRECFYRASSMAHSLGTNDRSTSSHRPYQLRTLR